MAKIYSTYASHINQGPGLLSKINVKFYVSQQGFSNVASDSLAAVLPVTQAPEGLTYLIILNRNLSFPGFAAGYQ